MRNPFPPELEKFRVNVSEQLPFISTYTLFNKGSVGTFLIKSKQFGDLFVISTIDKGWDHVSVSRIKKKKKLPNWDEMCFIKDLFFDPEELVVQYHPRKSEYVNTDPYVLHLWRKQDNSIPSPPISLV